MLVAQTSRVVWSTNSPPSRQAGRLTWNSLPVSGSRPVWSSRCPSLPGPSATVVEHYSDKVEIPLCGQSVLRSSCGFYSYFYVSLSFTFSIMIVLNTFVVRGLISKQRIPPKEEKENVEHVFSCWAVMSSFLSCDGITFSPSPGQSWTKARFSKWNLCWCWGRGNFGKKMFQKMGWGKDI